MEFLSQTQPGDQGVEPAAAPQPGADPLVVQPGTPAAPGTVPVDAPQPTMVPQAPQGEPQLLEQVAILRAELAALRGNPQPQPQQPQAPGPQAPQGYDPSKPVNYTLEIPDNVMMGLSSDDPVQRKAAVSNLLGGFGRYVDFHFRAAMNHAVSNIPAMVQNMIREHSHSQRMHDDFYGKYAELNIPHLKPMIGQIAGDLARRNNWGNQWTDAIRDAVAREAFKQLGRPFPGTVTTPAANPRPPAQIGGGKGTPGTPVMSDTERQIRELM